MDALKCHEIYRCISAFEVSRASRVADASRPVISRFIGGRFFKADRPPRLKKRADSGPPSDLGRAIRDIAERVIESNAQAEARGEISDRKNKL